MLFRRASIGTKAFNFKDIPINHSINTRDERRSPVTPRTQSLTTDIGPDPQPILKRPCARARGRGVGGDLLGSGFFLDGGMIPRDAHRSIDERGEGRAASVSSTAVLEFRGRNHVVRLVNVSGSGAMVIFPYVPHIGEKLRLQLLDRGQVAAQVRWVKDGRVGLSFAAAE